MTVDVEINNTLATMSEELKYELLHYAKYLVENYSKGISEISTLDTEKQSRGGFGIWKGKIWMSDDFDDPIEDMKDYM